MHTVRKLSVWYKIPVCRVVKTILSGKHISLVICVPQPRKHIPSDMCSPAWDTRSPSDMCSSTWSNHLFCGLHLILLPLAFHPASLHASTKVSLSNSDAVSTWIEVFISVAICLPLPAPPGDICRLHSLIFRLLKIVLTTLQMGILYQTESFLTVCISLVH